MNREWVAAAELVGLPGLPTSRRGLHKVAARCEWPARPRQGRGGGLEYRVDALPADARAQLAAALAPAEPSLPTWDDWHALTEKRRQVAERRVAVLHEVRKLTEAGVSARSAVEEAAQRHEVSPASVWNWRAAVRGLDSREWVLALIPDWKGGRQPSEIPEEAWELFKADYLRLERPAAAACWDRLRRVAGEKGWPLPLPSCKTFLRRLESTVPHELVVLAREGVAALDRLIPPQERNHAAYAALEAVNADGHRFDVFVRWPDGTVKRPVLCAWQDIYSGKLLSWRLDETENVHSVRLSFGDLVERYGIPAHAFLDNGRAFASKWMSGQTATRYRFKVRAEDPAGILTTLGVKVHWTTPYHGQAKPIERAFRDLCETVARHPRCAGAYTGGKPDAKPENYASRAVPLAEFAELVEQEIRAHNARPGRRSPTAEGRSLDETFAASYSQRAVPRATAAQRALWLLAAERVSTSREDGSIRLLDNRYWSEALPPHAGSQVVVRFDPQKLHGHVLVYTLDGRHIGEAPCIQRVGFDDAATASEHARLKARRRKAARAELAATRQLSALEVAKSLPPVEDPGRPESAVVQLARPAVPPAREVPQSVEQEGDAIAFDERFMRAMSIGGGQ